MGLRDELDALKTRRRNVTFRELDQLLAKAGFSSRQGKGDHVVYSHPDLPYRLSIDSGRRPLLPAYVGKTLRAIEEVIDDD
jgi:predicted RNA binding protein YcfA (HicA-like mRNA interferase family)